MWNSLVLLEDSLGAGGTSKVWNWDSYSFYLDGCARSPGVGLGIECSFEAFCMLASDP